MCDPVVSVCHQLHTTGEMPVRACFDQTALETVHLEALAVEYLRRVCSPSNAVVLRGSGPHFCRGGNPYNWSGESLGVNDGLRHTRIMASCLAALDGFVAAHIAENEFAHVSFNKSNIVTCGCMYSYFA